jgi:Txe/YoeB family toxin of Txe-Axe toxin-antitoxin module
MSKKAKKKADAPVGAEPPAPPPSGQPPPAGQQETGPSTGAAGQAPPPPSGAPLPLVDLSAADLGAFFELTFPDKRLLALCHELRLHTPGYRLEALPPDQVARVLADEYVGAKDVRPHLEGAVREELRWPVLEERELAPAELSLLIDLVIAGDPLQHLARIAWRALLSSDEAVRKVALEALDEGIRSLDASAKMQKKPERTAPAPGAKEAEAALKRAERAERERELMKTQLATARGEIAQREQRLAEERAEHVQARAEVARLAAEVARLSAAGEGKALADARRYADEARALSEKLRSSEEARAAAEQRAAALARRLAQAPAPVAVPATEDEDLPTDEEASTFLVPVLTREFYDSIDRWDRRMQRAAFDKILRLATDWRHGSLRALQLEGVPGYYRIRVATDVRLIYRRDGNRLEILSLIDREDLDRYIRQARTRPA